jgi:hypothetical protein
LKSKRQTDGKTARRRTESTKSTSRKEMKTKYMGKTDTNHPHRDKQSLHGRKRIPTKKIETKTKKEGKKGRLKPKTNPMVQADAQA